MHYPTGIQAQSPSNDFEWLCETHQHHWCWAQERSGYRECVYPWLVEVIDGGGQEGRELLAWAETRNASRRVSRVKWYCLRQEGTLGRINYLAAKSPFGLASFPIGWTCAWHPGNKNHLNYAWPPWPVDDIRPKLHSLTSSSVECGCCRAGLRAPPVRHTRVMIR